MAAKKRCFYMPPGKYRHLQAAAKAMRLSTSAYVGFLYDSFNLADSAARVPRRGAAVVDLPPDKTTSVASSGDGATLVGPRDHEHFEYRYAAMAARTDSPSVASLEANGWEVVHVDPRYFTRLMRRPVV